MGGATGVPNYNDAEWASVRFEIVKDLNRQKFLQNEELQTVLLETGDSILVEGAGYDRVWGAGLSTTHADIQDPTKWRGQNLLGKLLMELREELS